jgi:hypothetical protein
MGVSAHFLKFAGRNLTQTSPTMYQPRTLYHVIVSTCIPANTSGYRSAAENRMCRKWTYESFKAVLSTACRTIAATHSVSACSSGQRITFSAFIRTRARKSKDRFGPEVNSHIRTSKAKYTRIDENMYGEFTIKMYLRYGRCFEFWIGEAVADPGNCLRCGGRGGARMCLVTKRKEKEICYEK